MSAVPPRTRRENAWWEPSYDPGLVNQLRFGSWTLPDNAAHERLFTPTNYLAQVGQRQSKGHFEGSRFTSCDFSGRFDDAALGSSFTKCEFENCDFGTSTWERVKFRNCTFRNCSLSQSTWRECEFRGCTWDRIGLSGNETILQGVYISNPSSFIGAAYTNTNTELLTAKKTTPDFQLFRLEETKATVARSIFNNHKSVGDDAAFYAAFSTYVKQYSRSLAAAALREYRSSKRWKRARAAVRLVAVLAEGKLNNAFGWITKWGSSALRPLMFLLLTFLFFTVLYRSLYITEFTAAASMSFDVTSVAGFTRSVTATVTGGLYVLAAIHLSCAVLFYTAFFSVAITKISRVR